MKNLTPELIEKAKAAKSAEELLEIAKANDVEMSADEAKTYFFQLNPKSGELDDDDLEAAAGGGACEENGGNPDVGKAIRITDGTVCKNCGGSTGKLCYNEHAHSLYVRCDCGKKYLILPSYEVL